MRGIAVGCLSVILALSAHAQGFAGDLLAGKLIKPRVGQWSWYDLHDSKNNARYVVREAVVGEEKVGKDTGYWLEIEIVPEVGYKTVMKALLTGPASDPRNIKRVIFKNGLDPVQELPVDANAAPVDESRAKRESVGSEDVQTLSGAIRAERFKVTENGVTSEVWINKEVLPTGIVRLQSANGEWILRNHGFGGKDGESVLPGSAESTPPQGENEEAPIRAEISVEGEDE